MNNQGIWHGVKWHRDWEREGAIVVENPTTIDKYNKLSSELHSLSHKDTFFVFGSTQEEWMDNYNWEIKDRGLEGKKIFRTSYGMFGTKEGLEYLERRSKEIKLQIFDECNPQEVYFYEYNNHESMIDWEGDSNAWRYVVSLFGSERCNKEIRRA